MAKRGRPPGAPNKLKVIRAEEVARSGKRPPAENLRVIADRAMAMAAHYQPELTNRDTGEKTAVPFGFGFSKIERIESKLVPTGFEAK